MRSGARTAPQHSIKNYPPPRGMVSAFLCGRPGHGSARLLAIFRRKLRVAILLLVVGVTPTGNGMLENSPLMPPNCRRVANPKA